MRTVTVQRNETTIVEGEKVKTEVSEVIFEEEDLCDGETFSEVVANYLLCQGARFTSGSEYRPYVWYFTEAHVDPRSGEERMSSFFHRDLRPEDKEEVFRLVRSHR